MKLHEPAVPYQALVQGAEPAAERRVDGRSERDRLPVHRPAGRDDYRGSGDQALRVDCLLGHDQRREAEPEDRLALLGRARQDDGVDTLVAADIEDIEERVAGAGGGQTSGGVLTMTSRFLRDVDGRGLEVKKSCSSFRPG